MKPSNFHEFMVNGMGYANPRIGVAPKIRDVRLIELLNYPLEEKSEHEGLLSQTARKLAKLVVRGWCLRRPLEGDSEKPHTRAVMWMRSLQQFNSEAADFRLAPALRVDLDETGPSLSVAYVPHHPGQGHRLVAAGAGRIFDLTLKGELWRIATCGACKLKFLAERRTAKYCSDACRQNAFAQGDAAKVACKAYNRSYYLEHVKGGKAVVGKRPRSKKAVAKQAAGQKAA
jgi:hypothetical protein